MWLDVGLEAGSILAHVSQSTIHTIALSATAWGQDGFRDAERIILNHYIICNDTNEALRFGQVCVCRWELFASILPNTNRRNRNIPPPRIVTRNICHSYRCLLPTALSILKYCDPSVFPSRSPIWCHSRRLEFVFETIAYRRGGENPSFSRTRCE